MNKLSTLVAGFALCIAASSQVRAEEDEGPVIYFPVQNENAGQALLAAPGLPILYHGGAVMGTNPDGSNTPNLYFVWYGDWTGNTALDILPDMAANIGGSAYFNIETTYTDGAGNPVLNAANYGGSAYDFYSQSTVVTSLSAIVRGVLDRGDLPLDDNGV